MAVVNKGVEGFVYLLFKSIGNPTAAVLYKFKIGDWLFPKEEDLEAVGAFYEGRVEHRVRHVACVSVGIGKFFIVPNEFNQYYRHPWDIHTDRVPPYILTLGTKQEAKLPQGPKADPFACVVGNKVYVLSRRTMVKIDIPEPSFEAYDLETDSWESLETPPFHENAPVFGLGMRPSGFAVYEHFLIFCVWNRSCFPEHSIHSYDTRLNKWKPVHFELTPLDDDDTNFPYFCPHDAEKHHNDKSKGAYLQIWDGEGVVFGNVIYAHLDTCKKLVSYTCTKFEEGSELYDLSLGKPILSKAYQPHVWTHREILNSNFENSVAIGKLTDDMLYVVTTLVSWSPKSDDLQPVHVTIFRTQGPSCRIIREFPLYMPRGRLFDFAKISSCFMLQPEGAL